jgi:hypothetical protein
MILQCRQWTPSRRRLHRLKHKQQISGRSSKRSPGISKKNTKVRWLGMSHMSVLGAYWKQGKEERKDILGKKACTREATIGRKRSTCTCMEDLTTLGLRFLQYIVMVGEPKKCINIDTLVS